MFKLIYFGAVFVLELGIALVCMADGITFGLLAAWLTMMVLSGAIK